MFICIVGQSYNISGQNWLHGVMKHRTGCTIHTGPKHRSFRSLFLQTCLTFSNSRQVWQCQNVLIASFFVPVPECINCQLHCAFEPFLTADIWAGADGTVSGTFLIFNNRSGTVVQITLCAVFKYTLFSSCNIDSIFFIEENTYVWGWYGRCSQCSVL